MADTDRDWHIWGETDPYYSVVAAPQFRREAVDLDQFFQTGEAYIVDRLGMLEQQLGQIARGRALDFGCGVGRVALPMAGLFDEVDALDISHPMLEEGEKLRLARGIGNVHFRRSDDELRLAVGPYDFVHSYIVFQHIPVERGMGMIARLLDRVAVGGIANIHVAIRRGDTPLKALFYRARVRVPGLQRLVHRLRGKKGNEPMMQMNAYPASAIFSMMHVRGFGRAIVDVERHGRFLTMHVASRRLATEEQA
ncbi:MAG: class I SAM-dependent methyltransferase [Sphingobium sp.]